VTESIESTYFNWLYAKVLHVENPTPSLTFWNLMRELHNTEFVWLISGDDNRAEDGLDLRHEFVREANINSDREWSLLGCSVLEMLIAFSRRTPFETDRSPRDWFWSFLENLGLSEFNDANAPPYYPVIAEILYVFVWRTYEPDGRGGLFPIINTRNDQRKIELWYQFSEYLVELERGV